MCVVLCCVCACVLFALYCCMVLPCVCWFVWEFVYMWFVRVVAGGVVSCLCVVDGLFCVLCLIVRLCLCVRCCLCAGLL